MWTVDGLHLGLQHSEGTYRLSAGSAVIDTAGCGGLIGHAADESLQSSQPGGPQSGSSKLLQNAGLVTETRGNDSSATASKVSAGGRLENVCMNARDDGHLCDTKARVSHWRGDSACTQRG